MRSTPHAGWKLYFDAAAVTQARLWGWAPGEGRKDGGGRYTWSQTSIITQDPGFEQSDPCEFFGSGSLVGEGIYIYNIYQGPPTGHQLRPVRVLPNPQLTAWPGGCWYNIIISIKCSEGRSDSDSMLRHVFVWGRTWNPSPDGWSLPPHAAAAAEAANEAGIGQFSAPTGEARSNRGMRRTVLVRHALNGRALIRRHGPECLEDGSGPYLMSVMKWRKAHGERAGNITVLRWQDVQTCSHPSQRATKFDIY